MKTRQPRRARILDERLNSSERLVCIRCHRRRGYRFPDRAIGVCDPCRLFLLSIATRHMASATPTRAEGTMHRRFRTDSTSRKTIRTQEPRAANLLFSEHKALNASIVKLRAQASRPLGETKPL